MDERSRRAEHVYRHGCVGNSNGFLHVPLIIWGKKLRGKTANKYQEMAIERALSRH